MLIVSPATITSPAWRIHLALGREQWELPTAHMGESKKVKLEFRQLQKKTNPWKSTNPGPLGELNRGGQNPVKNC